MNEVKFLINGEEQTQVVPEGISKEVFATQVREALIEAGHIDRNAKMHESNGVYRFETSYGEAG